MCVKGAVEYRFYDEQLREQPFAEFCPRYFGLERRKYGETEIEIHICDWKILRQNTRGL